jgi:proteasome regulatory subunit
MFYLPPKKKMNHMDERNEISQNDESYLDSFTPMPQFRHFSVSLYTERIDRSETIREAIKLFILQEEAKIRIIEEGGQLIMKVEKDEEEKVELAKLKAEKIRLERELRSIRTELDRMRKPPLVIAEVIDVLDDGRVIIKSSTGPRFVVEAKRTLSKEDLQPGTLVAINQRTFSITDVVNPEKAEEIEVAATGDDKIIQLKSLAELYKVVRTYKLPLVFKRGQEYLAFSIYSDFVFRYKSET